MKNIKNQNELDIKLVFAKFVAYQDTVLGSCEI